MRLNKKMILAVCMSGILLSLAVASRIHRPNLLGQGSDDIVVSFFQSDYKSLLKGLEEELSESRIIVIARSTGKREYVYGNLKQEIAVERVVRGTDKGIEGKRVQWVGNGWMEHSDIKHVTVSTGFVNYLQKGDCYLVFAEDCKRDYSGKEIILKAPKEVFGIRCLNLSKNISQVCKQEGDQTEYKNVKDSEFFTNDEETLESLEAMKQRLIHKFVKE